MGSRFSKSSRTLAAISSVALLGLPVVLRGQAPVPPSSWTAPVGVPQPPFGITETAATPTHYVDNTHAGATDSSNPNGTPTRPRATVPTSLPSGSVVEVRGGPYVIGSTPTWTAAGTASSPVFIRGVGGPVFIASAATAQMNVAGSYFVIEGVTFDRIHFRMQAGLHHFALRRSIVRNYSPTSNSSAVSVEGTDIVIFANEIHNNGDPNGGEEVDIHGIKLGENDARVWIVDNHIHHNGGDSVQIGSAIAPEPWARFVYVGRNVMHNDRENAVDVKQARDIVISENDGYGYIPRSSSSGEAIIVHNTPERVWVLSNRIRDSARGIVSTGASGFYVLGNLVTNIHEPGFSTTSLSDGHGIMARATSGVVVGNNTVWNVDGGISQDGTSPVEYFNNLVGQISTGGHHLGWGSSTSGSASLVMNNLLQGSVAIDYAGTRYRSLAEFQAATGKGQNSINADPMFVGNGNFALLANSPATNKGYSSDQDAAHPVFARFQSTYPSAGSIARDFAGKARPVSGASWDLGAYESEGTSPSTTPPPAAPTNLRIIR